MTLFRPTRERYGPDRYLRLKMVVFLVGAAAGLVGMAVGNDWLVGIGIAVLAAGVLLRLLSRRDR